MERPEEPVQQPLTTQELIDQLFEQHDAEVHALFSRLLGLEPEPRIDGAA